VSVLQEFLAIRRAVALWDSRADAELGAVHGIGLSDFAALHHLADAPGGRLRETDGNDARATFAVLTRSGKTLTREAAVTVSSIAESILGSLGERDRAVFGKLVVA